MKEEISTIFRHDHFSSETALSLILFFAYFSRFQANLNLSLSCESC
ncbi:MAG: hypothetical protein LBR79_06980 [Oscillospiraceae bacterium]|nr:hypothetical protein [Oscillospiraceae bacterium]